MAVVLFPTLIPLPNFPVRGGMRVATLVLFPTLFPRYTKTMPGGV